MRFPHVIAGVAATAAVFWASFAGAQLSGADDEREALEPATPAEAEAEAPAELPDEIYDSRPMYEITVIAGPHGQTPFELEMEREAQMRESIYADMRMRERDAEDVAWRQADPDLRNKESRFKWGYSAQAEQRMRRANDTMYDLPIDQTKPATIFRAEF
jgi:hypothetical protein